MCGLPCTLIARRAVSPQKLQASAHAQRTPSLAQPARKKRGRRRSRPTPKAGVAARSGEAATNGVSLLQLWSGTQLAVSNFRLMSRQPLHQAILERGVATLEAYLGLATTLIVDLQRGLVTPERASTLMLDAMPENVALPAAIVEEMCDVLLDAIARGGAAPDAASARLLSALFRQLAPRHALVERARALGVLVDDA